MLRSTRHSFYSGEKDGGGGSGGGEGPELKMKFINRATASLKAIRAPLHCIQGPFDFLNLRSLLIRAPDVLIRARRLSFFHRKEIYKTTFNYKWGNVTKRRLMHICRIEYFPPSVSD